LTLAPSSAVLDGVVFCSYAWRSKLDLQLNVRSAALKWWTAGLLLIAGALRGAACDQQGQTAFRGEVIGEPTFAPMTV
jgi:hypothetical protein